VTAGAPITSYPVAPAAWRYSPRSGAPHCTPQLSRWEPRKDKQPDRCPAAWRHQNRDAL